MLSFKNNGETTLEFDGADDLDSVSIKTSHVSAWNYVSWFSSGLLSFKTILTDREDVDSFNSDDDMVRHDLSPVFKLLDNLCSLSSA